MKNAIITLIFLFSINILNAQVYRDSEADKIINGSNLVTIDENSNTIKHICFPASGTKQQFTRDGKEFLKSKLPLPDGFDLIEINTTEDKFGTVIKYQFTCDGIPIEGYVYGIQMDGNKVVSANGYYKPLKGKNILSAPKISEEEVLNKALSYVNAKTYQWETDENFTIPKGELIYLEKENELVLVYKIDIYSAEPLSRQFIYIDVETGEVEKMVDRIQIYTNNAGTAITKYQGTKTIATDYNGGIYRLRENVRGNGIETYDLNNGTSYSSAVDFTDADNYWNTTTNQDDAAYDAHYGSEATYDYYFNKFGRRSIDGYGYGLRSYVHYSSGYVNAFWNGSYMTYGDGNGSSYTALTCIDIVAHEITHGLTSYTSNLYYSYESGALNESFSDIFGTTIDFYANPTTANYLMGDQISSSGTPFRSMINPNLYSQPDTYHGSYWYTGSGDNGGVHYNSGVQNYWFYLLCVGGSGTNDIGNTFNISPIGMEKAAAIAYKTLTYYLTPTSQYADARYYSIQSAIDLYGECSLEVVNVTNAWYAVGVGAAYSNSVVADYTVSQNFFCDFPATAQFTNKSFNATSYLWDFGDSTTSILANPTHTYDSIGNYTVTLISTGTSICNTSDTLVSTNPIIVTDTGGPVSASCTPTTVYSTGLNGIVNFTFNGIANNSSGSTDGYKDYTCNFSSTLTEGFTYNYSITTGTSSSSMVKLWIDLNNDGIFNNTNELLVNASNVTTRKTGVINIPHPTVYNRPLRLRIASDMNSASYLTNACTNSQYGQYEDYSVIILQNTLPPIANFSASNTIINSGQSVAFTDSSLNLPTSRVWTFPGGTPSTSTLQNPVITYSTIGKYTVKLKAQNIYGKDSLEKTSYITVVESFNMCSVSSATSSSGTLYDSGGSTGNYQNGENCSFLIDPGCATSITLSFSSFYLESCCDYFSVYNGTNSSGPLLLRAYGSTLPNPVTASSGKMFITFTSDGSVTYSGFQAMWTSVIPAGSSPVADFNISDTIPPLNTGIQFTDLSTNVPTMWHWNFGDGITSSVKNPSHSFSSSGLKTITLISSNCRGSDTISKNITVQKAPKIGINPEFYSEMINNCHDSLSRTMVIKNTGEGDLEWYFPGFYENVYDNFDPFIDNSVWQSITGGNATNSLGYFSAPNSLYFNGSGTLQAISKPIDVTKGENINFYLEFSDGNSFFEMADSGKNVVLSYSTDGGISWANIKTYYTGSYTSFTFISETIPESAKTNATQFKWSQASNSGTGNENWSIDNFSVSYISHEYCKLSVHSGTISPGDSSIIKVTFNSTGLKNDVYSDSIPIFSNDPRLPLKKIASTLTVYGNPEIALSDTSILFTGCFKGQSITDTFSIINIGCDDLLINNITTSKRDFSINKTAMSIAPGDSEQIIITFSPSSIGNINGHLTIYSNDTDTVIYFSGIGLEPPVMVISPNSFSTKINSCDDSLTFPLTIWNQGENDLTFKIEDNSKQILEVLALTYGVDYSGEYKNTLSAINQYFTDYHLTEINTTVAAALGTALKGKDVLLIAEQEIGSSSVFTGFASTIQSFVNNGGEVIFCGTSNSSCIFNTGIFSGSYLGGISSGTLTVVNTTHPITEQVSTLFPASNATFINNFTNTDTIRLVRYLSNYDIVTMRKIGKGKAIYIAFDYFAYDNNAARLIANAVKYGKTSKSLPEWLNITVVNDTVSKGDSIVLDVTFNSSGLKNGVYTDSIFINSNDPLMPLKKIACALTVDGSPDIAFRDTCFAFSGIFKGLSVTDTFSIYNDGCDALLINNITSSQNDFKIHKTAMNIASMDSELVGITFSPSSVGVINGYMTIHSNDTDTIVSLKGIGLEPPVLNVSPNSIDAKINFCNDSLSIPMVISNKGGTDLTFRIEGNSKHTSEVLALTYGVDYSGEYQNTITAINQYFTDYHLTEINTTIATTLETALVGKDVLLIAEQENGSASVFTGFASVLQSYVNNGGSVIFCGTDRSGCILNTGLFTGSYISYTTSGTLNVLNSSHPITELVSTSFSASDATFYYSFTNSNINRLVGYSTSYDIVSCREIGRGKVIYVGFDYYSYSTNAARIIANAVRWSINSDHLPEWLKFSEMSDTLSNGNSTVIDVNFNSSGLNNGIYSDSISIYSNDPLTTLKMVACTLTVDGSPQIAFSETCIHFGSLDTMSSKTNIISIFNYGCDTLLISNITSSQRDFTINKTVMNIAPRDSELVSITFSPASLGSYNEFLTIYSNTADTILCLNGTGLEPRILAVSANSVNIAHSNGSTRSVEVFSSTTWTAHSNRTWLTIYPENGTGNRTLTFTAEANNTGSNRIAIVTVAASNGDFLTITVIQKDIGTSVMINKTTQSIEIDGFLEDVWDAAEPVQIEKTFRTENPTVTACWQALWNDNVIYVVVIVEDDNHWPAWEAAGDSWLYDKPEVYWDVNEVLTDGGGGGTSPGHWQLADGFTDGMYDTPITKAGGASVNPGGTYAYSLIGEGYVYEMAVPWANLKDNTGTPYNPVSGRLIGFDVTVVDQDEGITTARQRAVWTLDGDSGGCDEGWNNMDGAGTLTLVEELPENLPLTNLIISGGETTCYNAISTITVAGGGTFVEFLSGSTVDLIAGSKVLLLPGFHANAGSLTHAYITTDGTFCGGVPGINIADQPAEKSAGRGVLPEKQAVVLGEKSVKVYPNPNNGLFTLEFSNVESGATVCIYNLLGARVYQSSATNQTSYKVNLPYIKRGIYLVKVTDRNEQFTKKMIVN